MADRNDCTASCVIVLPSLNPDEKFDRVLDGLLDAGFEHIVVIDDGSDDEHQIHFEKAAAIPACTVIHHAYNMGKGRALKDGFACCQELFPDAAGVITIDGDGQHLTKDIAACGNRMLKENTNVILGCRNFFGIRLSDTQTGLRAIPMQYLKRFCEIEGERFEYETNMLLQMKRWGIRFSEQEIETVYEDENAGSHYDTLKDSWRIFKIMSKALVHRKKK